MSIQPSCWRRPRPSDPGALQTFEDSASRRRPSVIVAAAMLLLVLSSCSDSYTPRNGDILFQTSRSAQSLAIQRATHSPYSHMGIVFIRDGAPYVYEAVEPVKLTPLPRWIRRGERGHFVAKRLADADHRLTEEVLRQMHSEGERFQGRHYDLFFEWSDDRIYCSELVWKIYQRAVGIEIGALETIRDFDLTDPIVAAKVEERFGGPPPADEPVISPAAMFDSPLLKTVYRE